MADCSCAKCEKEVPMNIKCYKVSNIVCGAKVIWNSLEGAVDDIVTELEEMDSKERAESVGHGLDSVAKEFTVNALSNMNVGEKINLFKDYFTVEVVEMTRQELEALPEHDGC